MAIRYVWSGATGGGTGADWTNAYTTYGAAVTASTQAGDIIKIHKTHAEALSADTTYTFAARVLSVVVDKDAADALATMDGTTGYIGHTSLNRGITIAGAFNLYFYGLAFRVSGSVADNLALTSTDGQHCLFDACKLYVDNSATGSRILPASAGSITNQSVILRNCTFRFGNGSQGIGLESHANIQMYGCSVDAAGTIPTAGLFKTANRNPTRLHLEGCDWSAMGSNYLIADQTVVPVEIVMVNCKLHSGAVATTQSLVSPGSIDVSLYNCSSGDTHYHIAHYAGHGNTVVDTAIYISDGATPDGGTTRTTWKVTGLTGACQCNPYISPWFDVYNAGGSSLQPYVEILRNDSTTAFKDNEVWVEFSYQGNSGSPQSLLVWDRQTDPSGSGASQDNGAGLASWTGESGTAWSGKLMATAAFTPAEVGHLRARIYVAGAFVAYVDPKIRT